MEKPVIYDFEQAHEFVRAMIQWKKKSTPRFSVRKSCDLSGELSPALVTLISKGRRAITPDRVPSLGKILGLTSSEQAFFLHQVCEERKVLRYSMKSGKTKSRTDCEKSEIPGREKMRTKRCSPANHLLSDWVHPYVKDACSLAGGFPTPQLLFRLLGGIATEQRIRKSLDFLMREGFLRKTLDSKTVVNDSVTTTSDGLSVSKIRRFHKNALKIASRALELYSPIERRAGTVLMTLDDQGAKDLHELLGRFHEELTQFAESRVDQGTRLYQVVLNFCPVGGKNEL